MPGSVVDMSGARFDQVNLSGVVMRERQGGAFRLGPAVSTRSKMRWPAACVAVV